jgi:MoaA/NifB/PqqE/SkfB family radical SAM enzyme
MLQVQSNGDVTTCPSQKAVGNIKTTPIREIWMGRPQWWKAGCCLERRLAATPGGCDGRG